MQGVQEKDTGAYTAAHAALGGRTVKTGQSRWFVGYKKHSLRLWWREYAPTVTGTNAVVSVLTTVTNPACGDCLSATRTWLVSDELGNQVTCSQTVAVVDTTPPIISCDPDLVVAYGSDWAFDAPTARDAGVVDTFVYDNSVNDLLYRFDPGPLEVGNEIVLAGSARYASLFSFEFWGVSAGGYEFEGDVQARVRFYQNDGPPASGYASPGTVMIFDEFQVEAVVPLTTPLPDSFTWTVQPRKPLPPMMSLR